MPVNFGIILPRVLARFQGANQSSCFKEEQDRYNFYDIQTGLLNKRIIYHPTSFFLRSLFNLFTLFSAVADRISKTFPLNNGNRWIGRERERESGPVSLTWQSNQRAQPSAKSLSLRQEKRYGSIRWIKTWRDLTARVRKRESLDACENENFPFGYLSFLLFEMMSTRKYVECAR